MDYIFPLKKKTVTKDFDPGNNKFPFQKKRKKFGENIILPCYPLSSKVLEREPKIIIKKKIVYPSGVRLKTLLQNISLN